MANSGKGSIINISSISGIVAGWNTAAYNSSKAGVRHLSKSIALYCGKKDIDVRCNSVHPAFVNTPILDPMKQAFGDKEAIEKLSRQIPIKKIGDTDDVAYAVLYLASDESKFMTGAEIVLDGGLSAM
jgi:NAD(P)-dependent dehydrogenase (short-subunit alcohol dehydrogenase family)